MAECAALQGVSSSGGSSFELSKPLASRNTGPEASGTGIVAWHAAPSAGVPALMPRLAPSAHCEGTSLIPVPSRYRRQTRLPFIAASPFEGGCQIDVPSQQSPVPSARVHAAAATSCRLSIAMLRETRIPLSAALRTRRALSLIPGPPQRITAKKAAPASVLLPCESSGIPALWVASRETSRSSAPRLSAEDNLLRTAAQQPPATKRPAMLRSRQCMRDRTSGDHRAVRGRGPKQPHDTTERAAPARQSLGGRFQTLGAPVLPKRTVQAPRPWR